MSEVKRYGYLGIVEEQDGEVVKHEDYVALKAKCDALAAENGALKNAMMVTLDHVDVMDSGSAGVVAMIAFDALHSNKTPATDAYINAVRAEGAGAVAEYHKERFEFIKNTRHDIANEHKAAYLCALDVAAQLRAGE